MTCEYCGTKCGTMGSGPLLEGNGPILFLFSEYTSEVDYNGTFFGGKYGRVLDKVLHGTGLGREDITCTSVKCCLGLGEVGQEILDGLLDHHEIIVLFGTGACKRVLRRSNTRAYRGQSWQVHKTFAQTAGKLVGVTYGIEDAIQVPNYLKVITQDVLKFTNVNKPDDVIKWEYWDGQEIPDSDVYAYDIETIPADFTGKNYTETATQCAVRGSSFCFVSRPTSDSANSLAISLRSKLRDRGGILVGHNSWNFDVPRTRIVTGDFPLGDDTMALAYIEDETQSKGLESLSVKHLGVKGWKDQFDFPLGTPEFAAYNARDVIHTYNLYHKELEVLGPRIRIYDYILKPAQAALMRMSDRGIFIDKAEVQRVKAETEVALESVLERLRATFGPEFNPASPKQLAEYFESRGFVLPVSEKGNPSTASGVLERLDDPIAQDILSFRGHTKRLNTYVANYERLAHSGDGRVHPTFSVTTTVTGRTSAKNQNTQNVDRDLKSFLAAEPGHVLLTIDWDAVEFRIAAWVAQEQSIIKRFQENPEWDPHRYIASMFYGKPEAEITKDERQVAKSANFSQLYMGNAVTMQEYAAGLGLMVSIQTCSKVHELWHKEFPGFMPLYESTKKELKQHNYVETATGRRRNYYDFKALPWKKKGNALREAVNVKVQGLAADIALLTLVELDRIGLPLVNFVHDSFTFEFPTLEGMMHALPNIQSIMENYPKQALKKLFDIDFTIPLRAKPEYKQY